MHRLVAELMLNLFRGAMEGPPSSSEEVDRRVGTPEPLFMDMCNRDSVPTDLAIICNVLKPTFTSNSFDGDDPTALDNGPPLTQLPRYGVTCARPPSVQVDVGGMRTGPAGRRGRKAGGRSKVKRGRAGLEIDSGTANTTASATASTTATETMQRSVTCRADSQAPGGGQGHEPAVRWVGDGGSDQAFDQGFDDELGLECNGWANADCAPTKTADWVLTADRRQQRGESQSQ